MEYKAGTATFALQKDAELYLSFLPQGVSGRTLKTESGRWMFSWRKATPRNAKELLGEEIACQK